ncbi:MAG: efflux RND transporter periplasmic adaptor subunit [Gammaproteobacteria bacterium]|nr:efflux RND transporter periplasmic adaptor subunit [Gammaproteobacteria bacterium]
MTNRIITWPRIVLAAVAIAVLPPLLVTRVLGPSVAALEVQSGRLLQNVVTTGRVVTRHRVQVGSELVGTVVSVHVDEGERVAAGETLIELDDATQRAALRRAEAGLVQAQIRLARLTEFDRPDAQAAFIEAQAAVAQAEREVQRRSDLRARNLLSAEELDRSELELARARAALARVELRVGSLAAQGDEQRLARAVLDDAQAALEQARAELERTAISAPVDGLVLRRRVEPGDTVQPGAVLLVISPGGRMEIEAPVDEVSLQGLAIGQAALVEADAYPDQVFEAQLSFISPQIDPERGNLELRLSVDDPPAFLRQDMTVSVDIRIGERERALAVPNEALRDQAGNRARVWLLDGRRVQDRQVTLGLRGLTATEVVSGLSEGDLVLPRSAEVEDGQRVRARPR